MRPILGIIVHHTASAVTTTPAQIEAWHQQRGISPPGGYHHMLWQDPATCRWEYAPIRTPAAVGAHDKGQNADTIGVVVAGDYTKHRMDPQAWASLVQLVASLCHTYDLAPEAVEGHRENEPASTPTACPGWDVAHLREALVAVLDRQPIPPHLLAGPPTDGAPGVS